MTQLKQYGRVPVVMPIILADSEGFRFEVSPEKQFPSSISKMPTTKTGLVKWLKRQSSCIVRTRP
jgi:hypothetical protein